MRPPRLHPDCPRIVLALCIVGATFMVRPPAHAAPEPAPRPVARSALGARPSPSADALLAAADEKQRVPKPPEEKPRYKPDEGTKTSSSDDDDQDSSCLGSCIGSFFESLFFHSGPEPSDERSFAAEPHGWELNDHGWLLASVPGGRVALWQDPVEEGRPEVRVGHLPDGTEVVVTEMHARLEGLELRVRPVGQVGPVGWISSTALSPAPPTPAAPAARTREETGRDRPSTRWGAQFVLGGGWLINHDLAEEYDDGGLHLELHYLGYAPGPISQQWAWSAGVGFWSFRGSPRFNYVMGSLTDDPANSTVRIYDFTVEGGQRFGTLSGFRATWMLGPALYYVHETAEVTTYDASVVPAIGTRNETLGRWNGGGVARLGLGWRWTSQVELDLQVDGYLVGWDSQRRKSLTSDYTRGPLGGMDIGLALTYPAP